MIVIIVVILFALALNVGAFTPLRSSLVTARQSTGQLLSSSPLAKQQSQMSLALSPDEEEEFFESEFDRTPLKERLPAAGAFLAAVSLPFIIGLIYLYSNK